MYKYEVAIFYNPRDCSDDECLLDFAENNGLLLDQSRIEEIILKTEFSARPDRVLVAEKLEPVMKLIEYASEDVAVQSILMTKYKK